MTHTDTHTHTHVIDIKNCKTLGFGYLEIIVGRVWLLI